jgi:hypothetical protein
MSSAMALAKATTAGIDAYDFSNLLSEFNKAGKVIVEAGVYLEDDFVMKESEKVGKKFIHQVTKNLEARFSDHVSEICILQSILKDKPLSPDLKAVANIFHIPVAELNSEWKFLRRLNVDLSSQDEMIALATSSDRIAMFPSFALAIRHLLLLPIGTATVERSFSTLNRILCSKRCRLNTEHIRQLMLIKIEGPQVPDILEAQPCHNEEMDILIDSAYLVWLKNPRRITVD